MAWGETEAGAVVFEDGEAVGLGFFSSRVLKPVRQLKLAREIVILAEKMPVVLSGVCLAANGFDDVLAVEHADQPVDLRHFAEQPVLCRCTRQPATTTRLHLPAFFSSTASRIS